MKEIQRLQEIAGIRKASLLTENIESIPNTIEGFPIKVYKEEGMDNLLYIDIIYDKDIASKAVTSFAGEKTSSGQQLEQNSEKALQIGNNIKDMLTQEYEIEDISVDDLENGKVQVFAVSNDFLK